VTNLEKVLKDFNKEVIKQARANLTRKGKRDTNTLYKEMNSTVSVGKNSFYSNISFGGAKEYWDFIDKGVKGATSSNKAPKSPYKFGTGTTKGGFKSSIDGWVKRKGIQFRQREGKGVKGQFLSYDQTSFLIRRSIWNKGLETTNFISRPFELAFKRLPNEVVQAYSLDLDSTLKYIVG
jgi:hypothetical protein